MSYLEVTGGKLYYETVGKGPTLLCISGANGNVEPWRRFADSMKEHFTVVLYDRRGYSRSTLIGEQDYQHKLEADADDAATLIKHISPEPATVIGNSSGAIVSLQLLVRHPDLIHRLLPHEPPAMKFLPDFDDLYAAQQDCYNTYKQSGLQQGFQKFIVLVKAESESQGMMDSLSNERNPDVVSNATFWWEHEMLFYVKPDFEIKDLEPYKNKLLLLNGELSNHEALQYRTNIVFSEKLRLPLVILPGAHLGFASHPADFSQKLLQALDKMSN